MKTIAQLHRPVGSVKLYKIKHLFSPQSMWIYVFGLLWFYDIDNVFVCKRPTSAKRWKSVDFGLDGLVSHILQHAVHVKVFRPK